MDINMALPPPHHPHARLRLSVPDFHGIPDFLGVPDFLRVPEFFEFFYYRAFISLKRKEESSLTG